MKTIVKVIIAICICIACIGCRSQKQITNTSESKIETVVRFDTITNEVEKLIQDSSILSKLNIANDSILRLRAEYDSLLIQNALQDKRIRQLILDTYNDRLTIAPIRVDEPFAWAEAGILNNKLWLKLYQKQIVTASVDTTKTDIKYTETVIVKETKWWQDWKTYALGVSILLLCMLVIVLVKVLRYR